MENLFHSYWWLLFPLAWFVSAGFQSFLNYRRQQRTLDLIRTYAEKGQEPPEALMKVLDRPLDEEGVAMWSSNREGAGRAGDGSWFSTILFGVMAAGFGYAAWRDMYEAQEAFYIVTFVLAGLCLASLVSALRAGGRPRA